jgi:hypothetical protein
MLDMDESASDVMRWLESEAAVLWPAFLGSLSLRRSRCVRPNCAACLSGEQHQSSDRFHEAFGFVEVGKAFLAERAKTIRYLALSI